jgi:hypothetical protein
MYGRRAAGISLGLILFGCASVPPLAGDPITIREIVQRVKCEVAYTKYFDGLAVRFWDRESKL